MTTPAKKPIDERELVDYLATSEILIRVNNLLLSKLIVSFNNLAKELNIPKRKAFFRFEILDDEYNELVKEFGKDFVDKALYRLDRLLIDNKQDCPSNVAKYIRSKLNKNKLNRSYFNKDG